MLSNLTARPALAATASVAALCAGLLVVLPVLHRGPPSVVPTMSGKNEGDKTANASVGMAEKPAPKLTQTEAMAQPTPEADIRTRQEAVAQPSPDALTGATPQAPAQSGATTEMSAVVPAPEAVPVDVPDAAPVGAARETMRGATTTDAGGMMAAAPMAAAPDGASVAVMLTNPAEPPLLALPQPDSEAYANADANPVKAVAQEPVSTFSIDVDTASYSVVRSSLMAGLLPPPEAVRIEEMVNYFPYAYPAPKAGEPPFKPTITVTQTPWNKDTRLVHIGIQGRQPDTADRPPLNLVFLIDTSGSMEDPNKLPLLAQSFRLMVGQLRPEDKVAIVTYAGSAGEVLEPTAARDSARIFAALDHLMAGGSTAGQEGLQQAYAVAETMKHQGDVTRILLATDGDFNVGISDPAELETFIAKKRDSGTYLSVLGFGRGNLDDATMQALAQNGNGTAAYIDTLSEAQKVLVDQLTGALFPIADDVKIQMEFNPAVIAEYRLIGYETRALAREDFNNDKVDAGEIGAGTSVTALYEVTPVGSPALRNDPLRYQAAEPTVAAADAPELGFLKLRWKAPGAAVSQLVETPVMPAPQEASQDVRFAEAVAGMGQLLTGARYLGDWGWDDAITLANGAKGDDPFGYRADAVRLMRLAKDLPR